MNDIVYILLPVHDRKQHTRKFIDSLKGQVFQDYHLLLIDDGSSDGTEDMVRGELPPEKLTVIRGNGEWWWAGSLQQGIDYLKDRTPHPEDVILMINDDVSFDENFLLEGVEYLRGQLNTMVLAQFHDPSSDLILETGIEADLNWMKFKEAESADRINCLSTRGLFTSWRVIEAVGGFYTVLLPHYFSDYEYTIRAKRKGISLRTSSKIVLSPCLEETGFRDECHGGWTIDKLFSKKSAVNPLYASVFVLLACRVWAVPYGLIKVWGVALQKLIGKRRAS